MNKQIRRVWIAMLSLLLALALAAPVFASDDDNSLYSLGITTEGAVVSPEFQYGVSSYTVTVPAGTEKLELEPVASNENATITEISGTTLNEDGTGTVTITVEAPNGDTFPYTLNVQTEQGTQTTETETAAQTEKATEAPKAAETEPETESESSKYVPVLRDTVEQAENTIKELQSEIISYRDNLNLYTKIIYGLIALAVILLFLVINFAIRGHDYKAEVKEYRSLGYTTQKQQRKAQKKQENAERRAGKQAEADRSSQEAYARQESVRNQNRRAQNPQTVQAASQTGRSSAGTAGRGQVDVTPQTSRRARKMPIYEGEISGASSQTQNNQASSGTSRRRVPQQTQNLTAATTDRAQETAARTQNVSDRAQETAARTQNVSGRAQETAVRTEDTSGRQQYTAETAQTAVTKGNTQTGYSETGIPAGQNQTQQNRTTDNDVEIDMIDL